MSELSSRQAGLLAELREAHRAETAAPELRRRLLAQLQENETRRGSVGWQRLLQPALALSALVLAVSVLVWSGLSSPPREPPALALGPEVRNAPGNSGAAGSERAPAIGERGCPLTEAPSGAFIEPDVIQGMVIAALELHSFDMQTPRCGPIRRRFVFFVPPGLRPRTQAPVLIVLHDKGQSAETMHVRQTYWHFEKVARREKLVLVYANAAPGRGTDVRVGNSGAWQTDVSANPQVDDEQYLLRIMSELGARGVVDGANDVYLVGAGSGADMALSAAAHQPHRYSGVAAFFARGASVEPSAYDPRARLSRVLLVERRIAGQDWLDPQIRARAERWALGVGLPSAPIMAMHVDTLPPLAGEDARETPVLPLALQRWDIASHASGGAGVRMLMLDRHTDPFPVDLDAPGAFDGAVEAWAFLSGASGIPPAPLPPSDVPVGGDLSEVLIDGEIPPAPIEFAAETVAPARERPAAPRR